MFVQRSTTHLIMVIVAVVMPTALSLAYYQITGDPTVRPLGITKEAISAYNGEPQAFEIVAEIAWDARRADSGSRARLARAIKDGFAAKGVTARVEFLDTGAAGTWITYRIGPSTIGPVPAARAVEGIAAAVAAYRMSVPYEP